MLRLLCSCDRRNYGDLLFPIVTRWALSGISACAEYGLERSDLSAFGALPSRGIADLYQDALEGDVVLLAGGENLAQTWRVMNLTLLDGDEAQTLSSLDQDVAETLSRQRLGGRQQFPYILAPDWFRSGVRVMYNSMGGWPLRHYLPEHQKAIVGDMAKASFISVRDEESALILRGLDDRMPLSVAPDCVFLLSDMLRREALESKASQEVREVVRRAEGYFSFQCHTRYGDANREELTRQLLALADQSGFSILLTPIARMPSFEDHVFLESLASELGGRAQLLPASAGIYDVAYTLASAQLFCGTSLHGAITALTYDVPFVALSTADPKLGNNVKSWGLSDMFPLAPVGEIAACGMRSLGVDRRAMEEHSKRLRGAAWSNMQSLAHSIELTTALLP